MLPLSLARINTNVNNRSYEEVRIPTPWGDIAGKWWGPRDKRPILALHGWQVIIIIFYNLMKVLTDL